MHTFLKKFPEVDEICIVDDEYVPRFLARKLFGYEVPQIPFHEFENAEDALTHLNASPNQRRLILVDINMPVLDGWYLIEHMNHTGGENLIFILSSSNNIHDREKAAQYPNITGYLDKPLRIEQLEYLRDNY